MSERSIGLFRCSLQALLAFAVLLSAWVARAQDANTYLKLGNDLYNDGKYGDAVAAYTKAIQASPQGAVRAYLNRARAHNKLEQYPESVQYYQWYLELAPDADDLKKVKAEMKRVQKKLRSEEPWLGTESQRTALSQLDSALESGPFLTAQGGGAAAIYDVLLRTDYATPKLALIQSTLYAGLMKEALSSATPAEDAPTARLDRAGWLLQVERLERAQTLLPLEANGEALLLTARGWEALLRSDYARAAELFELAVRQREALSSAVPSALWGRALALLYSAAPTDEIERAIDDVEGVFGGGSSSARDALLLLEAKALQNEGKFGEAAALVASIRSK
ncbi:MAG: tetratricopeptide repeat protein [Myxococcota bacterium]|jgi:tetratricopeptide (TPR) repeat protein|nr:tetratricopeptide repeat protein [Myxococcota bacterium]